MCIYQYEDHAEETYDLYGPPAAVTEHVMERGAE